MRLSVLLHAYGGRSYFINARRGILAAALAAAAARTANGLVAGHPAVRLLHELLEPVLFERGVPARAVAALPAGPDGWARIIRGGGRRRTAAVIGRLFGRAGAGSAFLMDRLIFPSGVTASTRTFTLSPSFKNSLTSLT